MNDFESQGRYIRRLKFTRDLLLYLNNGPLSGRLKSLMITLFDSGNMHDALRVYTHTFSTKYFIVKTESVEIFVEELARKARECIQDKKDFSLESFICKYCNEIIRDPVTLKCGHTFSKQCALSAALTHRFRCPHCEDDYGYTYISKLKTNVTISSFIDKLSERHLPHKRRRNAVISYYQNKICEVNTNSFSNEKELTAEAEHPSVTLHTSNALNYFNKGEKHYSHGNWKAAFKAFLISWTLDPDAVQAKIKAVKVMRWLLRKKKPRIMNAINEDAMSSGDDEIPTFDFCDYERPDLHVMLDHFINIIKNIAEEGSILRQIDISILDEREFECPLCIRLLWEPVTTQCGHTFCRTCLKRSLDHRASCPLCKTSLADLLADPIENTTKYISLAVRNLYPVAYYEREAVFHQEMAEHNSIRNHMIPLFVCTVALPTVPCPLHVFEPRYRLMIRQCMEYGRRQFGMCGVINNEISEYGTMLEIRDVQYFPDGRSIVDTIGSKRFRILRRGERDGYQTGAVEFLVDQPMNAEDLQSVEEKHDRTYKLSKIWFDQLPEDTQQQILEHFGPMPRPEANYSSPHGPSWMWWMLAILPVETQLKVLLLSLTSLPRRLEFLYRILLHFQSAIAS